MKKALLIFAMLSVANFSFAGDDDDDDKKRPNGFRVGYQSSTLEKSSDKSASSLGGFYVGYVRKIGIIPMLRLETGLEYMTAGAKNDNSQMNLNYLVVPIQGVGKIGPVFALVGLNAAFKVSQSLEVNGNKIDIPDDSKAKTFDFMIDAGAGYSLLFLSLEARYYWGLSSVENGYQNWLVQVGLKLSF
jgi:hypothetical protein